MEITQYTIPIIKRTDKIKLYFLGDLHLGNGNHDSKALKETVAEIKNGPLAYWMGMGDYGDFIFYTDHRFSPNSFDPKEQIDLRDFRQGIMGQVRKIAKELEPINNKCIGLLTGNHEEKIANKYHTDATRELSFALGVPYLGYVCLCRIWIKYINQPKPDFSLVVCAQHGTRAPRSEGGKLNIALDGEHVYDADIYAVAHSHGRSASHGLITGITTKGRLFQRQRVFIVTSSYLENGKQATMAYSEKAGYKQSTCGSPYVEFWSKLYNSREIFMRGVV